MNGRCRTSQIINLVNLDIEGKTDVVPQDLKIRFLNKMGDVCLPASIEIVYADHLMPFRKKSLAKVRTQKAGTTGHQNPLSLHHPLSSSSESDIRGTGSH
jgi:hypothetical protein